MSTNRKGIILAGGNGSRLFPLTNGISKQLLPVYDKPMIYYPLSTLMLAGIKDFLIIISPNQKKIFQRLLGDGKKWGINIKYEIQEKPNGLVEAFIIGSKFIGDNPVALILGDNLYYGSDLKNKLIKTNLKANENTIFAYPVNDPERYGIVEFDKNWTVKSIIEKPSIPKSSFAVTGLYFYDNTVVEKAFKIKPSARGELEITALNNLFLEENALKVEILGRGMTWLDTGTFDSLLEAGNFIRTLEKRQGLKIGSPEEVAWRNNWINDNQLITLAKTNLKSGYGDYLLKLVDKKNSSYW